MKLRPITLAAAALALATGGAVLAAPTAQAQTITGFYCSAATAVPGATGSFKSCASYALSTNPGGASVVKPYQCRLVNSTNKTLNWYREAWTHQNGYVYSQTSYGNVGPGTWTYNCSAALTPWLNRGLGEYVRASVQAVGSSGTAGANSYAP